MENKGTKVLQCLTEKNKIFRLYESDTFDVATEKHISSKFRNLTDPLFYSSKDDGFVTNKNFLDTNSHFDNKNS